MFCIICNKAFHSPRALCEHIRNRHQNIEYYQCYQKYCRQSFKKLFNYERHIKRFHVHEIPNTSTRSINDQCGFYSNTLIPEVPNQPTSSASATDLQNQCASTVDTDLSPNFVKNNSEIFNESIVQFCTEAISEKGITFDRAVAYI